MTNIYRNLVQDCAQQGHLLMQRLVENGAPRKLYLHCKPSHGAESGCLTLSQHKSEYGLVIVTPEPLRVDVPYENYFTWVYNYAHRAPILPTE